MNNIDFFLKQGLHVEVIQNYTTMKVYMLVADKDGDSTILTIGDVPVPEKPQEPMEDIHNEEAE